jgi:hypothetical protein
VEVFSLNGQRLFTQEALGTRLNWNLNTSDGQQIANGVYLYVVTAYGMDGQAWRSEVRKLVIRR